MSRKPDSDPDFFDQAERGPGCWLWRGPVGDRGQPQVKVGGRMVSAHAVAWRQSRGELPAGHLATPGCGARLCVRPGHLFAATPQEYADEAVAHGWWKTRRGDRHGRAKLSQALVRYLRERRPGRTATAMAREFGVSRSTMARALRGATWRDAG